MRVHRRAVRHERCLGQSHGESAGRVDHRGGGAGNDSGSGLSRSAAVLARSKRDHAGGQSCHCLGAAGVGNRAGRNRGVSRVRLRGGVVLGRCRVAGWVHAASWVRGLATSRVDTSGWVRRPTAGGTMVRRLATGRIRMGRHATSRVRVGWLAMRVAVRRGRVDRCSRVDRRLAPARA